MSLCRACRAESDRWLDTTPAILRPGVSITYGSGAAYDSTPAGVRDNTRARYEDWRRLVREQMARIREQCQREQHTAPVQLDLLAELTARAAS